MALMQAHLEQNNFISEFKAEARAGSGQARRRDGGDGASAATARNAFAKRLKNVRCGDFKDFIQNLQIKQN